MLFSIPPPVTAGIRALRTAAYTAGSQSINFGSSVAVSASTSWLYSRLFVFGKPLNGSGLDFASPNTSVINDSSDTTAVSGTYSGWHFAHRVGTPAAGPKQVMTTDLGIGTGTATGDYGYVSHVASAYASVNIGGDGTFSTDLAEGYSGGLFAGNDHARLTSGATFWRLIFGREINVEIESGASSYGRVGVFIATGENAASQAAGDDAAIALSNKFAATIPWKHGLKFGLTWGTWPFDTSSTLIGAQKRLYPTGTPETTINANYGVDFSAVTFATGAFKSTGFLVDPSGSITGKDITLVPSASVTPGTNGQLMMQATSNTSLTFKYKGSDGTVRSGSITLS